MTTNELEGRALHEAAARAMGCIIVDGEVYGADGKWRGEVDEADCYECAGSRSGLPTHGEMMAWLRERRCTTFVTQFFADGAWHVTADGWLPVQVNAGVAKTQRCADLREALARLVVAVKEREEAKQA